MAGTRLQNDEPTLIDHLDRSDLVRRVGEAVATCQPPQVFGIHGDWGAGKTSFLHQLHRHLTGECPQQPDDAVKVAKAAEGALQSRDDAEQTTAIWFEAWRYQHEQVPIVALLQEIRTQLPWYTRAVAEGKKLGEVGIRGALMALEDVTKKIGIQASKIQAAGEKWEQQNLAQALPSHMVRQHLEATLKQLLPKPKRRRRAPRLVVLVDDLDRCEPEAAYNLLEGIKIYLNLPSCVFVLGMNQDVIESAIRKHLGPRAPRERVREYLEKLCQDIWHLPMRIDVGELLGQWLPGLKPTAVRDAIVKDVGEAKCLPANPRKIKAFANVVQRFAVRVADVPQPGDWTHGKGCRMAVVMACLYQFHRDVYRILEGSPGFYNDRLLPWATKPSALSHPVLEKLKLPKESGTLDESSTTPQSERVSTFPDPVRGDVFRIQPLVEMLGEVPESVIEHFLLR